jgi:hypothetical protein
VVIADSIHAAQDGHMTPKLLSVWYLQDQNAPMKKGCGFYPSLTLQGQKYPADAHFLRTEFRVVGSMI